MHALNTRIEILNRDALDLITRTKVAKRSDELIEPSLFPPPQLPLAAASPLSITKRPRSIMRHEPSTPVSLLAYLAISAIRITHLDGKTNLSHIRNNHLDAKGGGACEDAAKSPNVTKERAGEKKKYFLANPQQETGPLAGRTGDIFHFSRRLDLFHQFPAYGAHETVYRACKGPYFMQYDGIAAIISEYP